MIRKIMHRPQAVLGLAMMLLVFLVMLLAPVFAPNDPMHSTPSERTSVDAASSPA